MGAGADGQRSEMALDLFYAAISRQHLSSADFTSADESKKLGIENGFRCRFYFMIRRQEGKEARKRFNVWRQNFI